MSRIRNAARTKIVATVGPACRDLTSLKELIRTGVDVFRLNMAHGSRTEHDETVTAIRQLSHELDQPVGILVDLAGPKIRLGNLPDDLVEFELDQNVRIIRGDVAASPGQIVVSYPKLIDELKEGDRILLADATVELVVDGRHADYADCRVVQPGRVRSRQGVNLPGVRLSVAAMGPKDRDAARWAAAREVDFVSLSFVRRASDVEELRQLLVEEESAASVVAKIEKPEALDNLESIVDAADVVMVARGDLGVEIDIAEVPLAQKRIISACNQRLKPVIIATQMLASMEHTRHPTRAEVTDVANAVLDGGDACMLSGETAIGAYPKEAVAMMNRIAATTERSYRHQATPPADNSIVGMHQVTGAVVRGAANIARQLDSNLLVVATRSGATGLALSKQRIYSPVLALSEYEATLCKMALYWGLMPVRNAPVHNLIELKQFVDRWGTEDGCIEKGDLVVVVAGTGVTTEVHNAVEVHQV